VRRPSPHDPHRWPAPRRREQLGRRRTTVRSPPVPGRWSPRPRRSRCPGCLRPAGCRRTRDGRRPLAGHVEVAVDQLQPGAQCADAVKLGRRREAGCHDGDVEPPAATGPGEGLAKVARAGAHHGSCTAVGEQARDDLGATGLEAADRVRRFELNAHPAPQIGLKRLAAVQRSVEEERVDYPASRLDPGNVETRFQHDRAA
jgi:hypothetical protein